MVSKKKLKKITEVGFIPGIYNYCDRWCEKCSQRLHCMSFAMGEKIEERGGFNLDDEIARDDENVWARLKDVFESTYEVLHELADERGMDVEDIYISENIDKEFWGEDYENQDQKGEDINTAIESSDIIRICQIYEEMADKCLEKIFNLLDDKEKREADEKGKELDETLDVINWYLDLIQVKMRRALYGISHNKMKEQKEQEDYNGSAKVALIAIDRTADAWKTVQVFYPEYSRDILHIIVVLDQLTEDIEKEFKEARVFKRPGFDVAIDEN